jgi:hypothetical protein
VAIWGELLYGKSHEVCTDLIYFITHCQTYQAPRACVG